MSQARIPKRLSESILDELAYADRPTTDEFSLSRYQRSLENAIKENPIMFNGKDWEAIALVYFNQGKYELWEDTLLTAIREFNWASANSSLALGRLTLQERNKNYEFKPIVDEFYSNAKVLKTTEFFNFYRITDRMLGIDQIILKNPIESLIRIAPDYNVEIAFKEVVFHFDLEYLIDLDWDIAFVILQFICIKITNGTFTKSDQSFLNEIYPESILEKFTKEAIPIAIS